MAIAIALTGFFAACSDKEDNQYEIEQAKLTAMYPKFRTDMRNAKEDPNDLTDAFNTTFNINGGDVAKNADDSIKAALPTAQYFLKLCDEYNADFNKSNNLILKSTCEAAIVQIEIVKKLKQK